MDWLIPPNDVMPLTRTARFMGPRQCELASRGWNVVQLTTLLDGLLLGWGLAFGGDIYVQNVQRGFGRERFVRFAVLGYRPLWVFVTTALAHRGEDEGSECNESSADGGRDKEGLRIDEMKRERKAGMTPSFIPSRLPSHPVPHSHTHTRTRVRADS